MPRRDFTTVRDKFARDCRLPFGRLLTREYVLGVLTEEGHKYRSRVFCPLVTLWGWLSQCLSQDKSLNETVSRILAHRASTGLPVCSASSAAYSKARTRFPEECMIRMAKEIGRKVHHNGDNAWNWRGRKVFLVDGTGFTMLDTPENQLAYPQNSSCVKGLGFPVMRAVGLISLATGAVVDLAFDRETGKGTGESSLLRSIMGSLSRGDVLVADRYYPSYFTIAMLQDRGVDLVSVSHHARVVDFNDGIILGNKDHIAIWRKPQRPSWMSREAYAEMPDTQLIREFEIDIEDRKGGSGKAIVVSTITDSSVPKNELSDLYRRRWNCELDIRSIKHSLQLDFIRCKSPEMVRKEIWAHMLAWNLLRGVMVESAKRNDVEPRQLSTKGAMQAVESFTAPMMAIDGNETLYNAFLSTVSAHRVGNRPGRMEPRFKKRRPAWNSYMKHPRHEYRRRLASETLS